MTSFMEGAVQESPFPHYTDPIALSSRRRRLSLSIGLKVTSLIPLYKVMLFRFLKVVFTNLKRVRG